MAAKSSYENIIMTIITTWLARFMRQATTMVCLQLHTVLTNIFTYEFFCVFTRVNICRFTPTTVKIVFTYHYHYPLYIPYTSKHICTHNSSVCSRVSARELFLLNFLIIGKGKILVISSKIKVIEISKKDEKQTKVSHINYCGLEDKVFLLLVVVADEDIQISWLEAVGNWFENFFVFGIFLHQFACKNFFKIYISANIIPQSKKILPCATLNKAGIFSLSLLAKYFTAGLNGEKNKTISLYHHHSISLA